MKRFRQEMREWYNTKDMDIGYILTVLGIILFSMMLHELMHGFVALLLGDETARLMGRLTFNPLKHIDPFMTIILPLLIVVTNTLSGTQMPVFGGAKPVPFNAKNIRGGEWGVAAVAVAGPLTNFFLAFICYAFLAVMHIGTGSMAGSVLMTAVSVNLGFFAFNILPIPPLDGSRVLYVLAPDFVRRLMGLIERYGTLLVLIIVVFCNALITNYMVAIISGIIAVFARVFGVVS